MSNLLENRTDLSRTKLERTRELMDRHAPGALVTGYEHLIPALSLPDPDDRHVLAAAIRGNADLIVTSNIRDFPAEVLEEYDIEAQTPDEFVLHLIGLYPDEVRNAAEEHRCALRNPSKTLDEYLDTLERQGLVESCRALRVLLEA